MQQFSTIAITLLLVGAAMSQSLPGGYWTVYTTSQCTSGSEILYQWWNTFTSDNVKYANNIACTQLGSTSQYYTFTANQSTFDTSMFSAGNGWNIYFTPSDCSNNPMFSEFNAVKIGESCAAFEIYNSNMEQFPTSYNFPSCPSDGNGNATYLTYSTFDCTNAATQTISGPVGQCYMDDNGYPRLIYCNNYVAPQTPTSMPSAPMTAPTAVNAPTATPARSPSATPAKKSDAASISFGLTALVATAIML